MHSGTLVPLGRFRLPPAVVRRSPAIWASPGPVRGASLLLASSFSAQMSAALATTLFAEVSPAGAAGAGFVVAGLLLLVMRRPQVRRWSARRWVDVGLLGLTTSANALFFYGALSLLPLGTAVTIAFLGPLSLALVAVRRRSHLVAAILALFGVVLVSSATPSGSLLGLLLAFASAAGWAAYIGMSRRVGRWPQAGDSIAVAVCVAAVLCLPFSIAAAPELATSGVAPVLLSVAILGIAIPFRLELEALTQLSMSTAGIIFSAEPAIAVLVGVLALGQRLTIPQGIGVLAVVVAGVLALSDSTKPPARH
jgi:inner membrane transporter RhtA